MNQYIITKTIYKNEKKQVFTLLLYLSKFFKYLAISRNYSVLLNVLIISALLGVYSTHVFL